MTDLTIALPRCRYRVAAERTHYLCLHPAVRTRDGLVTKNVCSGCLLPSTPRASPRPVTTDMPRRLSPAGPERDHRPRVGFVTPNLVMGGAERWILNLLRYLDRERIALAGVALLNDAPADLAMCLEASESAPVFGGPDRTAVARSGEVSRQSPGAGPQHAPGDGTQESPDSPPVIRFGSVQEALDVLCRRCDVIVAWGSDHFSRLMAERRFAGKLVIVAHGSAPSTAQMLAASTAAAHHLVGVSRASAAAFRDPRATVIHNGADPTRCAVTAPRELVRRQWGAADGEILIGYVGRFSWEKNPLAAAQAAREMGQGYRAVYIGGGAHEDEVKMKVRELAPESIFVPPVEQIGDALNALEVFMLASPSEGFSLALTEAWLCGLPAVATRVGAVPELEALHGQMVVGVPAGASPDVLAAAARRALSSEGRTIAERARTVAWRHYTAQAMADRWADYLIEVVAKA